MKGIFRVRQTAWNERIAESLIQHIAARNIILDLADNIRLDLHIAQCLIFRVAHERRGMRQHEVVVLKCRIVSSLDVFWRQLRVSVWNREEKLTGPERNIFEYRVLQRRSKQNAEIYMTHDEIFFCC